MNKNKDKIINFEQRRKNTLPTTKESVKTNTTNQSSLEYEYIEENFYEDEEMLNVSQDKVTEEINDLRTNIKILNSEIENTNKIIKIVGSVIGLLVTILIFAINTKYDAIKDINNANMNEIRTEIKSINQRLDYQEKLNALQIERDINNKK